MVSSNLPNLAAFKYSVILLLVSLVGINLGGILFVGPLIVSLSPDILLIGMLFGVIGLIRLLTNSHTIFVVIFGLSIPLLAFNTRLPSLLKDAFITRWNVENFGKKQIVPLSQPIRIVHDGKPLTARRYAYAAARPQCHPSGCFTTSGFRTPLPYSRFDYWSESIVEMVLEVGFTQAKPDERAPTIEISIIEDEWQPAVSMRLYDAGGVLQSTGLYTYRNRFPFEPLDDSSSPDAINPTSELAMNFLLHGNFINNIAGNAIANTTPYPLKQFLSSNFEIQNQTVQAGNLKTVSLEILEEKLYEPTLIFKGENQKSAKDPWPENGYDAERNKFCDTLLRKESPVEANGISHGWWIFVQDTTGRNKIRRTFNELCDESNIWIMEYAKKPRSVMISKYNIKGELQYQLDFLRPVEIYGYSGNIRHKTFQARDGYLYFEWMDTNRPGYDLHVKRNLKIRLQEPIVAAHK